MNGSHDSILVVIHLGLVLHSPSLKYLKTSKCDWNRQENKLQVKRLVFLKVLQFCCKSVLKSEDKSNNVAKVPQPPSKSWTQNRINSVYCWVSLKFSAFHSFFFFFLPAALRKGFLVRHIYLTNNTLKEIPALLKRRRKVFVPAPCE